MTINHKTSPREYILITTSYLILTLILTYPLIMHMDDAVLGHDALYTSWLLAWGAHQIVKDPAHLFDTNVHYPEKNTLAFGEHLLGFLPCTLPMFLVMQNSLLVHNILLIVLIVATGVTTFILAKELTGSSGAAWIAGLIFTFCPYKFSHIFHLELIGCPLFPLAFLGFHRMMKTPNLKSWLLFTVCFVWQALMSWYYGVFLAIGITIYFLVTLLMNRLHVSKQFLKFLLLFVIVTGIILGAMSIPYFKASHTIDFVSNKIYMQFRSADLKSFLITPEINRMYGNMFSRPAGKFAIASLFPGIMCLLLILAAFVAVFRKKLPWNDLLPWLILMLCGVLLSLGPTLSVNGEDTGVVMPYAWLSKIPALSGIRVPERVSVITMLALAVMAAFGTKYLFSKIKHGSGILFTLIISLIVVAEYFSAPVPVDIIQTGDNIPEVYKWLQKQSGDFAILEFPYYSPRLHDRVLINDNVMYNYYSTYHWKKLVNGTSFHSPLFEMLYSKRNTFPDQEQFDLCKKTGVKYIIIHEDALTNRQNEILTKLRYVYYKELFIMGNTLVIEL